MPNSSMNSPVSERWFEMTTQQRKLFRAITMVVRCLDDMDNKILSMLKGSLGITRHATYTRVVLLGAHYEAPLHRVLFLWGLDSYIISRLPSNTPGGACDMYARDIALGLMGGIMHGRYSG